MDLMSRLLLRSLDYMNGDVFPDFSFICHLGVTVDFPHSRKGIALSLFASEEELFFLMEQNKRGRDKTCINLKITY